MVPAHQLSHLVQHQPLHVHQYHKEFSLDFITLSRSFLILILLLHPLLYHWFPCSPTRSPTQPAILHPYPGLDTHYPLCNSYNYVHQPDHQCLSLRATNYCTRLQQPPSTQSTMHYHPIAEFYQVSTINQQCTYHLLSLLQHPLLYPEEKLPVPSHQ